MAPELAGLVDLQVLHLLPLILPEGLVDLAVDLTQLPLALGLVVDLPL